MIHRILLLLLYLWTLALFTLVSTAIAQTSSYRLLYEVDLKNALVSPYRNVLKIYDVAVDAVRGRAYTSGSQTEFASMIDITSGNEIGSVLLAFPPQLNQLKCNPANGYLLALTPSTTPVKMYAINPANNQHTGTYTYRTRAGGIDIDVTSNHIFLSDGNAIKILNGDNLNLIDSFQVGFTAGGVAIDSTNQLIYVVSRNLIAGNAVIKVFSLNSPFTLYRTINVPSSDILGDLILDLPNNRIFLLGQRVIKTIELNSGNIIATAYTSASTNSKVYSPLLQTIFMIDEDGYSSQGEHGSWGKLYKYQPDTGIMDSVKMGDKPSRLAIDNIRNVLIVPSMHSGIVELLDLQTNAIDTIDVGESADEFALSPNGEILYIIKRLGGSRVILFNKNTHDLTQIRAGNWPCVAEVDSSLERLFVLNAFESSVSVFDCNNNVLIATIPLSILEGRTDAIPVMHLDQPTHRLYICFPEYEKIAMVNGQSLQEEGVVTIPGFKFNSELHSAIGVVQLITAPQYQKLFALQKLEKKLKIFDMNTLAFLDSVDLTGLWPGNSSFLSNLMEYDAISGNLFIGNLAINPVNYQIRAILPVLERVLGYKKDRSVLYGISARNGAVVISEHDTNTFSVLTLKNLFQQSGKATPVFYYDAVSNDLFIAEFNYAVLRHYDLDSTTTSVENETSILSGYFLEQNYPNPFNPSTTIRFSIPETEYVTLKVFNILGCEITTLVNGEMQAGEHSVIFNAKDLPGGVYFYQLKTSGLIQTRKSILIR